MEEINNTLFTKDNTAVYGGNLKENPAGVTATHDFEVRNIHTGEVLGSVHFQQGPVKECGVNGVHNEDLILMVLTRLQEFQSGEFACRENACAITKLEEAVMWLRKRTNDRKARNVEGRNIV